MPRIRCAKLAVPLAALALSLAGCERDYGTPYAESGPLPLAGPGVTLTRYRQAKYQWGPGRVERTLWSDGGTPLLAKEFIAPFREAIPEHVRQKLRQTTRRTRPDGGEFDSPDYYAQATVVSLRPDAMVLTIRPLPPQPAGFEFVHPFQDFDEVFKAKPRRERLEQGRELIDCEDTTLCFFAGTLLPYSEEMYLITTGPGATDRELVFEGNEAVAEVGGRSLRLSKSGSDVTVSDGPVR